MKLCGTYLDPADRTLAESEPALIAGHIAPEVISEVAVAEDTHALLDFARLQQLKDDIGEDNLDRIAPLFLGETRSRVTELYEFLLSEKFRTLQAQHTDWPVAAMPLGCSAWASRCARPKPPPKKEIYHSVKLTH